MGKSYLVVIPVPFEEGALRDKGIGAGVRVSCAVQLKFRVAGKCKREGIRTAEFRVGFPFFGVQVLICTFIGYPDPLRDKGVAIIYDR